MSEYEYDKQDFKDGGLLTASQMNNIDTGLDNAFTAINELLVRISKIENNIPSGDLGEGETTPGEGEDSNININLSEIKKDILKSIYPIGSIYVGNIYSELKNKTPKEILGFGTWEQIKDRFLYAAGDENEAGTLGGEAEHTLTLEELPNFNLPISFDNGYAHATWEYLYEKTSAKADYNVSTSGNQMYATHDNGNQPHNNMPPYITIYMWQRVPEKFFIDDIEYKVEEGMTWAEWCASDYNTQNYIITDYNYISNNENNYITLNSMKEISNNSIIIDENYTTLNEGGDSNEQI